MRPQVSHFNFFLWLHHQPTLPAVQQHAQMQILPPLQHPLFMALQHHLMNSPGCTQFHQPTLPKPAQTVQPQAAAQPNLPEQPQHPINPSQLMQPQQLKNPHLSTHPMNLLPHFLLDMTLGSQQSTNKKKQEEII
uniref:Amelogenin n=1 Tax=Otus sunia TaxID=257818 RepID=A0A8C8B5R5_9STRI